MEWFSRFLSRRHSRLPREAERALCSSSHFRMRLRMEGLRTERERLRTERFRTERLRRERLRTERLRRERLSRKRLRRERLSRQRLCREREGENCVRSLSPDSIHGRD